MATKLYHKDIYLPAKLAQMGFVTLSPIYSPHAVLAASSDRYGAIALPPAIQFRGANVVEAEFIDGKLTKLVLRLPYSGGFDLVVVILPVTRVVKTVWLNRVDDCHKTLDKTKFSTF